MSERDRAMRGERYLWMGNKRVVVHSLDLEAVEARRNRIGNVLGDYLTDPDEVHRGSRRILRTLGLMPEEE